MVKEWDKFKNIVNGISIEAEKKNKKIIFYHSNSKKYNKPIKETSIRPGEKMLESLINPTQAGRMVKKGSYYHIKSIFDFNKSIDSNKLIDYNSKINPLTKEELEKYLIEKKLV